MATRCGDSNVGIGAILQRFGVGLPRYIGDMTPRLRDRMSMDLVTVHPTATAAEALELIEKMRLRGTPQVWSPLQ